MAGTQFMKVNLSNLRMDDLYGIEGQQVTGRQIKDTIMNALNKLSDMGVKDLEDELFNKDGSVNVTKLAKMLEGKEYALKVFGIERGTAKPRKDIAKWAEIKNAIYYMYDEKFFSLDNNFEYAKINDKEEIKKILSLYLEKYFNINDDKQTWFDKIKDLSEELGYAREVKMFKQEPEKWKAHVGDVSTVLRVSLTGRQQTPDLYEIMQVLGKESVEKRFKKIIEK